MLVERRLRFGHSHNQREIFKRLFPSGWEPTPESARMAINAGLVLREIAPEVMRPKRYEQFQCRVGDLLALYRENTAGTLATLRSLNPYSQKLEWLDADEAHTRNKLRYWPGYLDGVAKAFADCCSGN